MAKGKYEYWLTSDGQTLLRDWARAGLTDAQIIKKMGISMSTLTDWKNKYPAISASLKQGMAIVDAIVEESGLLRRALGCKITETTTQTYTDSNGAEHVSTKVVEKEIPPDTTAAIFWLKNRRPDVWREKQEIVQTTNLVDPSFLRALNAKTKEAFENGTDEPANVNE